ncbi:MAG TPA: L,D-transpeptidase family protein, partial [Polyangiaceae bacterium]|nr:L,D-transpeptidase family protein [Polyangiaceae bacterium]
PLVGFVLATSIGGAIVWATGCHGSETSGQPAARVDGAPAPSEQAGAAEATSDPSGDADASARAPLAGSARPVATSDPSATVLAPDAPYDGPLLGATAFQTPVYPEPRFGDERLGYIRQGGKVPVDPKPIKKPNCKQGWYHLIEGGYVCGKYATTDLENPRVKLGVRQPDLKATLPYQYAYNRFHGTPLYKTLPSKDEMLKYEPYLLEEKKKKEEKAAAEKAKKDGSNGEGGGAASATASSDDVAKDEHKKAKHVPGDSPDAEGGAVPSGDDAQAAVAAVSKIEGEGGAPAAEEPRPWWQSGDDKPVVSLADLEKDSDGNLSKRMVKGFFIAIDKTFGWNGRTWYRTTSGLLAPTDRMWVNKAPEMHGTEWPEGAKEVGFILSEKAFSFEIDEAALKPSADLRSFKAKEKSKLAKFASVALDGKTLELSGTTYRHALDGTWIKSAQAAITRPGARPADVGPTERWVDVNLTEKTIVLFEGDKPVYASVVSPGKKSRNKKKDHATPTGAWRIREKHVAVTMDGDGPSGDLPYSIEDVPYVAYFKGSYALHGAFWHSNFGHEMSHGCVNLAPNDAKYVFNFVEPRLPRGWHAVFATQDHPGSMVVIHE